MIKFDEYWNEIKNDWIEIDNYNTSKEWNNCIRIYKDNEHIYYICFDFKIEYGRLCRKEK